MQEEFEKKVQERMLTFGMQPSPQVWDDIDAALGKRKHRRVFIGWWILLGLVIAGGGILFYQKDNILHNELNQQPVPVIDSTSHNNMAQTPAGATPAQKPAEATEPVTIIKPAEPKGSSEPTTNKTTSVYSQHNASSHNLSSSSSTKIITSAASANNLTTANTQVNAGITNTITGNNQPTVTNTVPNSNTPEQPNNALEPNAAATQPPQASIIVTERDSFIEQSPVIKPQAPVTTATNQPPTPDKKEVAVTPKTIASSRHQWFFTVGGGTTQTTNFGKTDDTKYGSASAPLTSDRLDLVAGYTALAAQQYVITRPKAGYNLYAGFTYQYKLAKRWRLAGGLQAAYLENSQQTGAFVKNNSSYVTTPSSVQGVAATDQPVQEGYYLAGKPGSAYTVVNKAWQLLVPVNASYVINPGAKTKVLVNAGVSAAWLLSSRWLIPDSRYSKLYYNSNVINGTIISWQAGPAIELKNQWKFGLQYQQSFTTLAKNYVTPRLYWQNISLYAGIPFNLTFKKAKK